jgi:diguanylate cyclase (GGDEF)-like protein
MTQRATDSDITEQLLLNLLVQVRLCQEETRNLDIGAICSGCLFALSALAGGAPVAFLAPDKKGVLRLKMTSAPLPFHKKILEIHLGHDPLGEVDSLRDSITELLPQHNPYVEVLADNDVVGVFVQLAPNEQAFSKKNHRSWTRLAHSIWTIIRTAQQFQQLIQQNFLDPTTGLHNQRYFNSRLSDECSRASRHNQPLGLIFWSIDDFQTLQSALGHQVYDQMLQQVIQRIRVNDSHETAFGLRRSDIVIRHGHEEFAIILPETPKWGVLTKAERLRQAIASLNIHRDTCQTALTASVGAVTFPEDASTPSALVDAAISAMRQARQSGKNRVESK